MNGQLTEVGLAKDPVGVPSPRPIRGRPPVAVKREMLSLRVDPAVLSALRASGKGWQTKVNELLREAVLQGKV